MQFNIPFGKRLLLLACMFVACFVVGSILMGVITMISNGTPAVRIATVVQDVLIFIVPAVGTAMLVTRLPARLLRIDSAPSLWQCVVGIATLVASIPAMNAVIAFNESLPFPAEWVQAIQEMEESAAAMVKAIYGPHNIPNLIVTILIVGVLAGLSEELLFRGALQRLLSTGGVNTHAAIWIAAIVFSLLHMQFYGFIPRMLLGAFFGYALWWSRSLWLPVLLHVTNNTLYLVDEYMHHPQQEAASVYDGNLLVVAASVLLTAAGLYILYRLRPMANAHTSKSIEN